MHTLYIRTYVCVSMLSYVHDIRSYCVLSRIQGYTPSYECTYVGIFVLVYGTDLR